MVDSMPLHELSIRATRELYRFVYAPAQGADPARLGALFEGEPLDADDAFANQMVRERLGLGDAEAFDPNDPVHRAALLPPEGLACLAWRLGLACGASRLRRLIRREDLTELGTAMSEGDWLVVVNEHASPGSDILASSSVEALPETCRRIGWRLLAAACDALPPDIGKRLRLKLPLEAGPLEHEHVALPRTHLARTCAAAASAWNPDWEAMWASSHSAS